MHGDPREEQEMEEYQKFYRELRDACEALLDEQNGVPLLNRELQYNRAVRACRECLAKKPIGYED